MSEVVIVEVSTSGETKVGVQGVSGPGCKKVSEAIEKALGVVTESKQTAEYHQSAAAVRKQT